MKVMKFGGSCLDGPLSKIVDIIESECEAMVVVLSALPGVTDLLHKMTSSWDCAHILRLREMHIGCARESITNAKLQKRTINELEERLRLLGGLKDAKDPRIKEYVVSFGERLSVKILEGTLISRGIDARSFEADDIGVIASRAPRNPKVRLEETGKNLRKLLIPLIKKGKIPIITGYFGRDENGLTTTFGRGGSDYSATAIAYALDADAVEIWKDFRFMTADPRIVKDARPLERLSYEEASELAHFGAKILHPRTMESAMRKGIPILIKDVRRPHDSGTVIDCSSASDGAIKSISLKSGLSIVKLYSPGMAYKATYARAFDALSAIGINVYAISTSQANLAMLIGEEEADNTMGRLKKAVEVERIDIMEGVSMICVVGSGMGGRVGVAASVFDAVREVGVNIEMISEGASDAALNFVVKKRFQELAVRSLHDALIRGG